MDRFGSDSPSIQPGQREAVMNQVRQQVQLSQFQDMLGKISHTCFDKCVTRPGRSLENSEKQCLSRCMDRWLESVNFVSRVYAGRIQREAGGGSSLL